MFNQKVLDLAAKHNLELVYTDEVKAAGIDLKRGLIFVNRAYMTTNSKVCDSALLHEIGHYIDAQSFLSVSYWYAQYTANLTNMIKSEQRANNIAVKLGDELGVDVDLKFFKENIKSYVLRGQAKLEQMTA